eukprot:CAMPEP_0116026958 /NCGR_PEP_ID=MMETSP0321-20121206/14277_1 /TAXON_ID=163516 /ORGANISM="Leptocylindrus danicus var. danicus, Strain B650" /LENGTH=181 /DNA_ID=CAMNT_0003500089 /DNA_START=121 /DNA_END=667 /DNA_ORIENTATION=+
MSSRRITWAKDLEQIVCEVDTLNLEERRAYWYAKNELRKICRGDASLASQFRQMGYTELKEAEAHFSHKGHSLRGLGMMKDDPMIFQAKVVKANRSMLGSQTAKSEAMKISRENAKAAYKMGLYDEKFQDVIAQKLRTIIGAVFCSMRTFRLAYLRATVYLVRNTIEMKNQEEHEIMYLIK